MGLTQLGCTSLLVTFSFSFTIFCTILSRLWHGVHLARSPESRTPFPPVDISLNNVQAVHTTYVQPAGSGAAFISEADRHRRGQAQQHLQEIKPGSSRALLPVILRIAGRTC